MLVDHGRETRSWSRGGIQVTDQKDEGTRLPGRSRGKSGRSRRNPDQRKLEIVARLLQGEPITILSRENAHLIDSSSESHPVPPEAPLPTTTVPESRMEADCLSAPSEAPVVERLDEVKEVSVDTVEGCGTEARAVQPSQEKVQERLELIRKTDGLIEIKADGLIKNHVILAAGAGMIPFPLIDLLTTSTIQLRLLAKISALYGVSFRKKLGKSIIGALVGGTSSSVMAVGTSSLLKSIPIVGHAAGICAVSIYAAASTYAVGHVFASHFRTGGTLADFSTEESKARYTQLYQGRMKNMQGESSA